MVATFGGLSHPERIVPINVNGCRIQKRVINIEKENNFVIILENVDQIPVFFEMSAVSTLILSKVELLPLVVYFLFKI